MKMSHYSIGARMATALGLVLALLLGHLLNGEVIGLRLWLGTGLILLGLTIHEGDAWLPLLRRARGAA